MDNGLDALWRKSTYSGGNGGGCVETASQARRVLVRDTTDRDGGTLVFDAGAWEAFTDTLKLAVPRRTGEPLGFP
jgi:hypothetical protein